MSEQVDSFDELMALMAPGGVLDDDWTPLPPPPRWMARAACAGLPEAERAGFYPDPRATAARAISVCRRCPVRPECLDYALDGGELGVWGGLTERERAALLR